MTDGDKTVREKILHILGIYPVLSPSMLQVGIGTGLPSSIWRPVLEELVNEGLVSRTEMSLEAPNGKYYTYTRLQLCLSSLNAGSTKSELDVH